MKLSLTVVFIVIIGFSASSQSCIELLDSVEHYTKRHPQKSNYYGKQLLSQLNAGNCNKEIGISGIYNNLGLILWSLGDQQSALDAFHGSKRFEWQVRGKEAVRLLDIYYNLSTLHQELGNTDSAEFYLSSAEEIVNSNGSDINLHIRHLYRSGIFYREIGKFSPSINALQKGESIIKTESKGDSLLIRFLIESGTTFRHFGNLKEGESRLLEAIELAKKNDQVLYLIAIDRLASLKIEEGQYSDSESYLLHNLEVKEQSFSDDQLLKLESLNSLGVLYYKLNDLEAAEKYVEKALSITEEFLNLEPYMLNNLGTIYMKEGRAEKALEYFQSAADGFHSLYGSMHPDYASCLNNLAGAKKELGQLDEALRIYTRVLDMDKVIYSRSHPRYATSLSNTAMLYLELGNMSLAGKLLTEVKMIRKNALGTSHPSYVKTLNDLGLYYLLEKDTLNALKNFDEALYSEIHHLKDVFSVLTDNQRKLYYKLTKSNIERFCGLALSSRFINTDWSEKALNYFINTKGILFYASDKIRRQVQNSNDDQIKEVYNDWRDKKYKLAQGYLLSEEDRNRLNISIIELEEECTSLEKKLALKFRTFAEQDQSEFLQWEDISAVLNTGESVVDVVAFRNFFARMDSNGVQQGFEDQFRYAAFVIKSDSVLERVSFRDDVDLNKAYSRYTNSLKYALKDETSYDAFWKPIDDKLSDIKRIYFSPDGIYYKMNPVVYYDDYKNEYVADKYDLLNITSSKDLLLSDQAAFNRNAIIFGNPAFGVVKTEFDLAPLPGAEREAQDISEILDVRRWDTETYYFKAATESKVKSLNSPGVIHIATHGYFNDDPNLQDPLHSSGLFLTTDQDNENDGILSAYEAMNLVLDQTNLVVLAACETGLGRISNGEGVFGLQRSFLVAGAEHVLISLVKINDQAARRFMNLYYEKLRELENPKDAFFQARKTFKNEDDNPYNWGAYIMVSK